MKTERLILRKISKEDRCALSEILGDSEIMYAWEHGFSQQEVDNWMAENQKRYDNEGHSYLAVISKEENKLIGVCGLIVENVEGQEYLGIGYIFNKNYWHSGYAYESAYFCLQYGFLQLNASEITAEIRPENFSSIRLANKLNMTYKKSFVKIYHGKEMIHNLYGISRETFLNIAEK